MDEEKKEAPLGVVDSAFKRILDYVGKGIQTFVAFLFFIFAAGAIFGYLVILGKLPYGEFLIILPAALGLIAYYNRMFAVFLFVIFILGFFLL